jgi:hypothetical protein
VSFAVAIAVAVVGVLVPPGPPAAWYAIGDADIPPPLARLVVIIFGELLYDDRYGGRLPLILLLST